MSFFVFSSDFVSSTLISLANSLRGGGARVVKSINVGWGVNKNRVKKE